MYKEIKENQELYEMANLPKRLTGLPVNLWVDGGVSRRSIKHSNYRLKFQNGYEDKIIPSKMIPISIETNNPHVLADIKLEIKKKDLKAVSDYIKEHFDDFEEHVKGEIDDLELIDRLRNKDKVGV